MICHKLSRILGPEHDLGVVPAAGPHILLREPISLRIWIVPLQWFPLRTTARRHFRRIVLMVHTGVVLLRLGHFELRALVRDRHELPRVREDALASVALSLGVKVHGT